MHRQEDPPGRQPQKNTHTHKAAHGRQISLACGESATTFDHEREEHRHRRSSTTTCTTCERESTGTEDPDDLLVGGHNGFPRMDASPGRSIYHGGGQLRRIRGGCLCKAAASPMLARSVADGSRLATPLLDGRAPRHSAPSNLNSHLMYNARLATLNSATARVA